MLEKTAPRRSGRLVRRLALAVALGASGYVAVGLTQPAAHPLAFVNEATADTSAAPADGRERPRRRAERPRARDRAATPSAPDGDGADATTEPPTAPTTAPRAEPPAETHSHIVARARLASSPVVAKHQDWTVVPLTKSTWTQPANAMQLIAGTVRFKIPAKCTGSFGNALTLAVNDRPVTFATAPTEPASKSLTMPFVIGTLSEPGQETTHTLTAKFGSSCTQVGEDYTVEDIKVDVLSFE